MRTRPPACCSSSSLHPREPTVKAASLTLCMASLAWQVAPAHAQAPAQLQRITIQLHGAPAELSVFAQRDDRQALELQDNGAAVLEGWFDATPSRSVQLRLTQLDERGETQLWSGLAMLTDRSQELLAFSYQNDGQGVSALRVPASPSLHLAAGDEPLGAYRLAMGWGALVLAWLGILVVGWAVRGRRLDQA